MLQGFEVHGDFGLTSNLFAEVGLDYVRGAVKDNDDPLPRIPPLRGAGGLRYQYNAFQVGGKHRRCGKAGSGARTPETPTDGYHVAEVVRGVLGAGTTARCTRSRRGSTTLTDELYRNHLSLIKDLAPEMGRNFKLLYNVKF